CAIKFRISTTSKMHTTIDMHLRPNQADGNTEIYVAGNTLNIDTSKRKVEGCGVGGLVTSLLGTVVNSIGGITCRGCETDADCGGGSTCGSAKVCRAVHGGDHCQGLQLGADLGVDAGSLLQIIDPGAEGALGLTAFLGSYVRTYDNGLQVAARLG